MFLCFTCLSHNVCPAAPHVDNFLSTQQWALQKSGRAQEGLCGAQQAVLVTSPQKQITVSCTHTTGASLFFIQQQQQKGRAVIECFWSTNYRTEGKPDMMYEHEKLAGTTWNWKWSTVRKSSTKCFTCQLLNYCLSSVCLLLFQPSSEIIRF